MKRCNVKARATCLGILLVLFFSVIQTAKADFVFGDIENLGPGINGSGFDTMAGISMDGLSLYFLDYPGQMYVSTRSTKDGPWGAAVYLGPLTPDAISSTVSSIGFLATISTTDGLEAYYAADLAGGCGGRDVWFMTRETMDDAWGPLVNVGSPVNTTYDEHMACVSPDGLELYFSEYDEEGARPGGYGGSDLWVTRRATRDDPWTEPVNLGPAINSAYADARPSISADGLLLFFDSTRPGGYGGMDLYVITRATLSDPWGEPINLGPLVNTSTAEECARISADGTTLYWDSHRPGGYGGNDLWQASIKSIVDFNSDGAVDCLDICDLIDHWGTDNSLYDIGPTPFGDGVVDAQDLIVLAEHLAEDANDADPVE